MKLSFFFSGELVFSYKWLPCGEQIKGMKLFLTLTECGYAPLHPATGLMSFGCFRDKLGGQTWSVPIWGRMAYMGKYITNNTPIMGTRNFPGTCIQKLESYEQSTNR